ncbi:MAG: 4-hydroxy-tetrahydrodipicolinate synthase [Candidatus Methanomethylophilaceae archaeon]|jgi:4-hydroxy-tetrahydrodipicolinate synthase|nr:4-hydroxy-tetrahydrodipicolinate synthase [Candidatus Methanomethylophilaceae archaeon]MDD2935947.1 4-hydroxy-tetrahydrodipicolinate synthase [Candidatus Methanomethylophilaceae archaeon]MDD3986982.1 4-hydroxy-tetrahydrodipicolinate synthase [Candidatus Methanomethylophilaceae archaeon]MDY0252258.1 4-hydroxy-tetrahydrodipicolinate synthase [Candidatus Methanomethylophilaceae archaeon]
MFAGISTALITPFKADGTVDEDAFRRLIDFQEKNGVDVIVPCGSTGESATLSPDEHIRVIEIAVDQAKKAKVLAGAGSNSTAEAITLSRHAEDLGADGVLSISPYYNKPTQEGIYLHYKAIAESVGIPIVVYNVPGRTGSNITSDTMLRMAEIPGIDAVKEASGNMAQIQRIIAGRPKGFEVLSGDDGLTIPMMSIGADGVISVAGNCCPGLMSRMVHYMESRLFDEALGINKMLLPLFSALFVESNPIPIKFAMGRLGFGNGTPRLPLTPLSENGQALLVPVLEELGL